MSGSHSEAPSGCSKASAELKLYQAFIFSVPIFFTFVLLFLFYLFYLRRRRVDWTSFRMRASLTDADDPSRAELGLKKELRELLPIIVFKETFSIRDSQCSICLGDYQGEDRIQQIPACGHTFHMECIDHWLATHTTCPLCRLSLLVSARAPTETSNSEVEANHGSSNVENIGETSVQCWPQTSDGETHSDQHFSVLRNGDGRIAQSGSEGEEK
ncbi:RING-H2 finger protein ATL7-like [Malania oleifera]|uniref:RING-H2 finger protein ATL7-like n=1 Tax=Malania oleifera TaxID=397392 RepID=UPI0025ADB525|nr:RING-H2 finger protein ATL7-like [Malania oleifera]